MSHSTPSNLPCAIVFPDCSFVADVVQGRAKARRRCGEASTALASTSRTNQNTATGKASNDVHSTAETPAKNRAMQVFQPLYNSGLELSEIRWDQKF